MAAARRPSCSTACSSAPAEAKAGALARPAVIETTNLIDWSPVAEPLGEPVFHTRRRLLHRNPGGSGEAGTWERGPGARRCRVERNEFRQFLSGCCVYRADSGERLESGPGDAPVRGLGRSGRER